MKPPETLASTDEVEVALHTLSEPALEPAAGALLLAHANGFCGRMYAPMARALPALDSFALDFRAHGDSTRPSTGVFEWQGYGDDATTVARFLRETARARNGRLFGFGHSLGGAALAMAELRHPGTFDALFLYEPIIFPLPRGAVRRSPMVEVSLKRRDRFRDVDEARANYASKPPFSALDPEVLELYLGEGFRPCDGGITLKCRPADESATFAASGHDALFEAVAGIRCPVWVAHGAVGSPGPAQFATALLDKIPGARPVPFPELGHLGPFEQPTRVSQAVKLAFAGLDSF